MAAEIPARSAAPAGCAAQEPGADRDRDQADREDEEDPDQPIELPLERRPATSLRTLEAAGDPAEGRRAPGRDHDALAAAADDARAGEGERSPMDGLQVIGLGQERGLLRDRFARQDAPIEGEAGGCREADVGRDDVPGPDQEDVARNDECRLDVERPTCPTNRRPRSGRRPQLGQGAVGAVLGDHVRADDRQQADEDEDPVAGLADDDGEEAGPEEQEDERLRRRVEDEAEQGRGLANLDLVASVADEAARRLGVGQPGRGIRSHDPGEVGQRGGHTRRQRCGRGCRASSRFVRRIGAGHGLSLADRRGEPAVSR